MAVNVPHVILSLVVLIGLLVVYYKRLPDIEGENKGLKLMKVILAILIGLGAVNLFAMSENPQFKAFWIILIAVLLNVFTVIHSTNKCNYPKLYIIQLCLYSAVVVGVVGLVMWYSHFNDLLDFFITDVEDSLEGGATDNFESTELTLGTLYDEDTSDCPDRTDDDYDIHMNLIRDTNIQLFNDCLEAEVRQDLDNELG